MSALIFNMRERCRGWYWPSTQIMISSQTSIYWPLRQSSEKTGLHASCGEGLERAQSHGCCKLFELQLLPKPLYLTKLDQEIFRNGGYMSGLLEVLGFVSYFRDEVRTIKENHRTSEFGFPNKHFARIGGALAYIYFPPDGILSVLKKLASGAMLDDVDKAKLVEFNQREAGIQMSMEQLILDRGRRAPNSLLQTRIMNNLQMSKGTLREGIQNTINHAVTFDEDIDRETVKELVDQIECLNREIEQAEHDLRSFN